MSADSPRRHPSGVGGAGIGIGGGGNSSSSSSSISGGVPAIVPPQTVSDRSILDSAIGFIQDVTLAHQPVQDPKDTIIWARFETCADVSDPRFGDDWELEGNAAPPLLLILGYGLGVQVWAIPANGEAVEVLSWRHGVVTALRVLPTPATAAALDDNGRADEPVDAFAEKRPLVALVDGGSAAAGAGNLGGGTAGGGGGGVAVSGGPLSGGSAQFSAVNFVSLKTGVQVKTIKFKNAVLDIQANRSAVVITFHERIAVFDARTLEDRLTITSCYPSPGINPNPIALGPRWLAYAEHKLLHSKRSGGGCDGEGVPSYTATVLNAAKSFGKGLRELGEQVAAGLTGTSAGSGGSSKSSSFDSASGGPDSKQSGVVTIIDVKNPIKDFSPTSGTPLITQAGHAGGDPIVAHFVAHSEALVAMEFDSSGMLLLTADRRGHDFHVFRIQPHPVGPSLAAVHHLYVLHRGDTSAKVQHIAFSLDSRWAAVSTLRGTTHVFPITPYGGAMGVRTHTSLHVVNKLSRFHRSAGLGADGRSSSPISHSESTTFVQSLQPYHNPTLPPFPRPSVVQPLAQLRQPFALGSPPGSAGMAAASGGHTSSGVHSVGVHGLGNNSQRQRQRLSSLSDDSGKPLSVCSIFAKSRSWLLEPPTATREAPHRVQRKAVDSLFVMAGHGALIQYDLDTKLASNVAKEKICDDTPIELEVEARAQWNLGRRKDGSQEIIPPLALDNWLIKDRHASLLLDSAHHFDEPDERAESWLAQVEIITHAGPHRRLWMGPQFVFKNYNTPSGSNLNHVDSEAVEIGVTKTTTTTLPSTSATASSASTVAPVSAVNTGAANLLERSSPLNMPLNAAAATVAVTATTTGRTGVPVLIESGSYSSIEQSPKLMDRFRHGHLDSDYGHGDMRLKEDLADAMRESPSTAAARRETGQAEVASAAAASSSDNACYYDALAEHEHEEEELTATVSQEKDLQDTTTGKSSALSALASVLPNICSYDQQQQQHPALAKIEKIVNPLGTVTDVNAGISGELQTDMLDEVVCQLANEDTVIHENCDEALFRPVVAIFCDELAEQRKHEQQLKQNEEQSKKPPPVVLGNKLIVPVIAKEVDEVLVQKEKQKSQKSQQKSLKLQALAEDKAQALRFAELSHLNKPKKSTTARTKSSNKDKEKLIMPEPDPDPEPESETEDHADNLLANKSSIAAVMVSSASAQGLSLHVETTPPPPQIYQVKVVEKEPSPWKSVGEDKSSLMVEDFPRLKPTSAAQSFDDFLESLPPMPALEPLEMVDLESEPPDSLINFESPLQENALALARKITPPPRGFTEQNLILALCGSLHYENEQHQPQAIITTTTTSASYSNSTSNNSSGSEEIILIEEPLKKLSKKHKRLKQQQQQQQEQDEELRPLISISMCDSQLEVGKSQPEPDDLLHFGRNNATTTDSEGPLPATTSDDNLSFSSPTTASTLHKLKTKKLEHKINLIAAIEAATSSSTSSAEESSVETAGPPPPEEASASSLPTQMHTSTTSICTTVITPAAGAAASSSVTGTGSGVSSGQPSATKKKTKRRKR